MGIGNGRVRSWLRERGSGIHTVAPTRTHAVEAGSDARQRIDAADVRLGLRAQFAAMSAGHRKARRAERYIAKAAQSGHRVAEWVLRRETALRSARTASQLVEIAISDRVSTKLGRATSWINHFLISGLVLVMLANDPLLIYTSMMKASDMAPDSIVLSQLTNPTVLIAVTAALGTALAILVTVFAGANALASLVFRGHLAKLAERYPAAQLNAEQTPIWQLWVKASTLLIVLLAATVFLHGVASANFTQGMARVFTGTTELGAMIVAYVTALPWVLLVLETIARAPQQAYYRATAVSAIKARVREAVDVRVNSRLLSKARRSLRKARLAIMRVYDVLNVTAGYLLYEAAESDLAGWADLAHVADIYRSAPTPQDESGVPIDQTGRVVSPYLPGLPVVSPSLANAINSFAALAPAADQPSLIEAWEKARAEADECAGEWLSRHADGADTEARPTPATARAEAAPLRLAAGD